MPSWMVALQLAVVDRVRAAGRVADDQHGAGVHQQASRGAVDRATERSAETARGGAQSLGYPLPEPRCPQPRYLPGIRTQGARHICQRTPGPRRGRVPLPVAGGCERAVRGAGCRLRWRTRRQKRRLQYSRRSAGAGRYMREARPPDPLSPLTPLMAPLRATQRRGEPRSQHVALLTSSAGRSATARTAREAAASGLRGRARV